MKYFKPIFPPAVILLSLFVLNIGATDLTAQRRQYQSDRYGYSDYGPNDDRYHRASSYRGKYVKRLPRKAQEHRIKGRTYYSHKGVFYRKAIRRKGYRTTLPPIGVKVKRLPNGARRMTAGKQRIYYANGSYYLKHRKQKVYEVVPPPGSRRPHYRSHRDRYSDRRYRGR